MALLEARMTDASSAWRRTFYIAGAALIAASLVLRLAAYPIVTSDYTYFIKVWFATLSTHSGLTAFAEPFADYAPLYLYGLKLLAFIPLSSLALAKTLSLLFDVVIAWAGARLAARAPRVARVPGVPFFAGAVLFALPTVMVNSSLWGQSDAIYGAGVLLSLLAMTASAPLFAALAFGFAISIKVQSVFAAPVFLGWLYRRRELFRYGWIPAAFFVATVLPAAIFGGAFAHWLFIYAHQAGEYPYLSVSAQSIFAFAEPLGFGPGATALLFWAGIVAAGTAAVVLAAYVARVPALSARTLVLAAFASALILPFILPRMHERYFYLADLLSVVYAFYHPPRFVVAFLVVFASLIAYMPFLSSQVGFLAPFATDLRIPAALLMVPLGYVVADLVRAWRRERALLSPPESNRMSAV